MNLCENLLFNVLNEEIQLDEFFKWFLNENETDENSKQIESFKCSRCEFISYFLDFIYEVLKPLNKKEEIIQKTPTSTKKEVVPSKEESCHNTPLALNKNTIENSLKSPQIRIRNVDLSYTSPLSPLYNNKQNFSHSKNNRHSTSSPKNTPGICLGDFLSNNSKSVPKKSKRNPNNNTQPRRIKPTNLAHTKFESVNNCNNFTFDKQADEIETSVANARSFLIEERNQLLSRPIISNNPSLMVISKDIQSSTLEEILPNVELVTFKQILDIVISLYSFLINNNFILNLVSVMNVLITVLVQRTYECSEEELCNNNLKYSNKKLFATIHNRIYFASGVLQQQMLVLKVFDSATLSLLIENRRLKEFTTDAFMLEVNKIYNQVCANTIVLNKNCVPSNVCFISETDNKDNFPNPTSFQAFRKQRDLFYDILRIWEIKHLDNQWNYSLALGGKIRSLLAINSDPTNLTHLARLFKAQLLVNTCQENTDKNELAIFSSVANVDSDKLSRLSNRIANKQCYNGINSIPTFVEYEEFYKDFLIVAQNHIFTKHVIDGFTSEITASFLSKYVTLKSEDSVSLSNDSLRLSYLQRIKCLRILSKFLGYLESIPYNCDHSQLSPNILKEQIRIRNEFQPSLNLKKILENSIDHNCLALTLPWMVNYIAMLDYVTLRLPYFEDIFSKLFEMYFSSTLTNSELPNSYHLLLVQLTLGWLFDLPHFPSNLYYLWLSERLTKKIDNEVLCKSNQGTNLPATTLDTSGIVDQNVIRFCCRYLDEIKNTLHMAYSSCSVAIKHITPSTFVQLPSDMTNKRLKIQLEESFLNSQPVSIRKTIEFVSERVASSCVKQICNEIVPEHRKVALSSIKSTYFKTTLDNNGYTIFENIDSQSQKYSTIWISSLNKKIDEQTQSIIDLRIKQAIESLLPLDVLDQMKEVCIAICKRTCHERLKDWVRTNVNKNIFEKDFKSEMKNCLSKPIVEKPIFALPKYGKEVVHSSIALNGFEVTDLIRKRSIDLIKNSEIVTVELVTGLLTTINQSIKERCDLNECITLQINKLLMDFMLLLVAHQPTIVLEQSIVETACLIWKESNYTNEDMFKTIVCPRNFTLLNKSQNVALSKISFQYFINILICKKLLLEDAFTVQITSAKKNGLNQMILEWLDTLTDNFIAVQNDEQNVKL